MADRWLPDWPAVMKVDLAAAYLSVSETTFRTAIAPKVRPIKLTRQRIGWRRTDLDQWIARQANDPASSPDYNPWDEP